MKTRERKREKVKCQVQIREELGKWGTIGVKKSRQERGIKYHFPEEGGLISFSDQNIDT
jgi:hypothetical protein